MKIDLNEIDVGYCTSTKYPERDFKTEALLKSLGYRFNRYDGGVTTPYTIGVAKGHLEALRNSIVPCLIVEDDIELIPENLVNTILVPEHADAVYIGTSLFGRIYGETRIGGTISFDYDRTLVRAFNMLSMHAILYTSHRYQSFIMSYLEKFIDSPTGGVDDYIADKMYASNVYALKKPIFYQNDGHSEIPTKTPLTVINK